MKSIIYILSLAIALNLGSHITVSCNMPTCAMTPNATCTCNQMSDTQKADGCCNHKISQKSQHNSSVPKCHQSQVDGVYAPTFTMTHVDSQVGFIPENFLLTIDGNSSMFTPQPTDIVRFKPDKYLNLPLLI